MHIESLEFSLTKIVDRKNKIKRNEKGKNPIDIILHA